MQKVLELDTLDQIKAISHPYRLAIIKCFSPDADEPKPMSAKAIASELGESPSKIHYHLKELEKAGILELVDTREVNGILEKLYLPAAEEIRIKKEVLSRHEMEADALNVAVNILDTARSDVLRLGNAPEVTMFASTINITPEDAKELDKELHKLLERYMEKAKGTPTARPHEVVFLTYPRRKGKSDGKE